MSPSQASLGGARRSLPLLPIECLLLIARYSEYETLQTFRLVSRAFQRLADPILWRVVRLVPNIDCLQSFLALVRTSSIAPHIYTLFYDTSWQALVGEIKFKHDMGASLPGGSSIDSALLARCIDGDVKSAEASSVELCLLTQILNALPHISSLQLSLRNEPRPGHRGNPPPYYRTICNNGGLHIRDLILSMRPTIPLVPVPHVRSLLLAAYANPVKLNTVGLDDLTWVALFQESGPFIDPSCARPADFKYRAQVFSSLKNLHLGFRTQPSREMDQHLRSLHGVLKICVNLIRLRIRFNDQVENRYSQNYRMFSFLAPFVDSKSMRPLMPRLSELHIASCLCTQSELLHFLIMHSSTLRVLGLSNISLLQSDGDTRGCWVQVINSLRHALRLSKVTFRGWLSNGGRQRWFVHQDSSVHPSRLRPQIEKFITRQSNCMPRILATVALKPGQEDLAKPGTGHEVEGDWSWTMTYSAKSKNDRRDFYSGDDFFSHDVSVKDGLDCRLEPSPPKWDDWFHPKATYSCPALLQPAPPQTKSHAGSILQHWSHPPSLGLLPLPVKSLSPGQKPPPPQPPSSSNWAVLGSSNSPHCPPTAANSSPPALHMSFHSTSTSNKSNSIHSTSSYLPYAEDDLTIGDFSAYQSPSQQQSPSQSMPSYPPSQSSSGSAPSFDLPASWPQPLPPLHPNDFSPAGDGSSASAASNLLSQSSSFKHPPPPKDLGQVWIGNWNYMSTPPAPPPPPNYPAMTNLAPATATPTPTPKSHFAYELHQTLISAQSANLAMAQAFCESTEVVALLKQKPAKVPSLGLKQTSYAESQVDASKPSFTYTFPPGPQGVDDTFPAALATPGLDEPQKKKDLCEGEAW